MDNCICNGCKNLKCMLGDDGQPQGYNCEFGFPSESCADCNEEMCNETCDNFQEDNEETEIETVYCKVCGKKLEKVIDEDMDNSDVFCIDCYLKAD